MTVRGICSNVQAAAGCVIIGAGEGARGAPLSLALSRAPLARTPHCPTLPVVFHRKSTGLEYPQWDAAGLPMLLPLGKAFANGGKVAERAMVERMLEALAPLRRQEEGGALPPASQVGLARRRGGCREVVQPWPRVGIQPAGCVLVQRGPAGSCGRTRLAHTPLPCSLLQEARRLVDGGLHLLRSST